MLCSEDLSPQNWTVRPHHGPHPGLSVPPGYMSSFLRRQYGCTVGKSLSPQQRLPAGWYLQLSNVKTKDRSRSGGQGVGRGDKGRPSQ